MGTKTRFEEEAKGNSEMAYYETLSNPNYEIYLPELSKISKS